MSGYFCLLSTLHQGTSDAPTVYSVGLQAGTEVELRAIVSTTRALQICDLRISPALRCRGDSYYPANACCAQLGVRYCHVSLPVNDSDVRELGQWLRHGPTILLGREPDHYRSERAVLCDLLSTLGCDYGLMAVTLACAAGGQHR